MAAALTTPTSTVASTGDAPTSSASVAGGSAPTTAAATDAGPATGLCARFTVKELSDLLGVKLGAGEVAGPLGTACQWSGPNAGDTAEYVQLQVVDERSWEGRSSDIEGYAEIPELGSDTWVIPELGGYVAAAKAPAGQATFLAVSGGRSTSALAASLLKLAIERA